jgi:ATP-binding cassette subfamily F protein 3
VIVGYFAQAHEGLRPDKTVLDEIMETGGMGIADARNHLGAYLFSGDDVFRTVATLSGGERGRLALAKLALSGANLLLLDEPTNHLDIDSQEVLQGVIEDFEGTVLLVSHDRYLIDALATQIWAIDPQQGIEIYEGGYQDYIAWRRQRDAQNAIRQGSGTSAQSTQYAEKVRGMSPYQLKKRVSELESLIAELEAKQAKISLQIEQASAAGDSNRVQKLGDEYEQIGAKLESTLEEWAELAEHAD